MKRIFHQFSALLLVFLVAPWPQAYAQAPEPGAPLNTFAWDTLEIVTESGRRHPFRVEMAITPSQQAQGLQWRKVLADDAGMLFDFGASKPTAFWMLNTYLSLDMIFIASGGKIDKIARATKPLSLAAIASDGPVRAVLEVRAGTAARLGIHPGDRVEHRIFH